jgi:hypothetical protein
MRWRKRTLVPNSLPLLESPRFSYRSASLAAIDEALATVGHVVLTDLWSTPFLDRLREIAAIRFASDDATYLGNFDKYPHSTIEVYLGGFRNFDEIGGAGAEEIDAAFFEEIERTGLPALYRRLLHGDFVVSASERVIRRLDPKFPLRFAGIHCDGQLGALSKEALRTDREITLWTPLQDCMTDEIARLLLLHRGETLGDFYAAGGTVKEGDVSFHPVQLRPLQFRDEVGRRALIPEIDAEYRRLFATKRCYAPPVPLGATVLFDKTTIHGSYHLPTMTQPRYSLDFRAVGEYRVTDKNAPYQGRLMSSTAYPPKCRARDKRSSGWNRYFRW